MKTFNKILGFMVAGLAVAACSPDDFTGADQNGIPSVEGVNITVDVDQSTNNVVVTAPAAAPGTYHVWNLAPDVAHSSDNVDVWSTLPTVKRLYTQTGDKKIIYRIGNRNGFSQGAVEKTIHIDNSLKDLSSIARALGSENGTKWSVAFEVPAHVGYGPKGGDGSGTWTAGEEKVKDLVCYDDVVTFYAANQVDNFNYAGTLDYDSGADGKLQIGGFAASNNKNQANVSGAGYNIVTIEDFVYLKLAAGTPLPFVPSEEFLKNPLWRIDYYGRDEIDLVAEDGDNAYRLVLAPANVEEFGFGGFTAGENLLANWQPELNQWFSGPGWGGGLTATITGNLTDGVSVTIPEGTGPDQWMGQVHIEGGTGAATLSADKTYDFSIVIESPVDGVSATVKPQKNGDDNTFFIADKFSLHKGANVIALSNVEGFDGDFKIALDFGGCPEGAEFFIRNFFLTEHDDANQVPFDVNDPNNVWKPAYDAAVAPSFFYWADGDDWHGVSNPDFTVEGTTYTLTATSNTKNRWQGQVQFQHQPIAVGVDEEFDISFVAESTQDVTIMFKFTNSDNGDNGFIIAEEVPLKAGQRTVFVKTGCKMSEGQPAATEMDLVLDYGGIQEGSTVKIGQIAIIRK